MPPPAAPHDVHEAIVDEAIQAVLSTVDLDAVLERTAALLNRRFGETGVAILRVDGQPPGKAVVALVSDPRHPRAMVNAAIDLAGTAAGRALEAREPLVLDPLDGAQPRFAEERRLAALGWGSIATFPLAFEGRLLGALQIASQPGEALPPCCLAVARRVADLVAIAFQNSLMVGEIRRLNQLLGSENALLREELQHAGSDDRYVAESPSMKAALELVRRVAPADSTVLIHGETGTGKEGLARLVHELSARAGEPFVAVNLAALPEGLVESELFGHEKGAFTGALRRRPGRFEQADGGTIFLDEVGDAPPSVQVRLLRVLQERELDRVGGTEPVKVDVRVVAATNRDLEARISAGAFREDLYYRLAVVPIRLAPLRERPEDIRPLVEHFLARHAALMKRTPPEVPEPLWATLRGHAWPGNVRELENFVQRALLLSPGPVLELPGPLETERAPGATLRAPPEPEDRPLGTFDDEVRAVIERALDGSGGRVYGPHGAAARLGLKPSTLQGKMKRYGVPEGRGRR
ncbi:MAG: sigma 54-interacting transcriptional regulator [Anaeromyxobacteraceae bacterium]